MTQTTDFIRGSQWKTKGGWWAVVLRHKMEGAERTVVAWHDNDLIGQHIRQHYLDGMPFLVQMPI